MFDVILHMFLRLNDAWSRDGDHERSLVIATGIQELLGIVGLECFQEVKQPMATNHLANFMNTQSKLDRVLLCAFTG